MDWQALSVQSVAILRCVLVPIYIEGATRAAVAKALGIKTTAIPLLVEHFTRELEELSLSGEPR